MKKTFLMAALVLVVAMFTACDPERQTPTHDTTELWPAYDSNAQKWGYINAKGTFAITANYDQVGAFSCGYALVKSGANEFFIDKNGKMQSAPSFDEADDFYYNYARVESADLYGMINTKFAYTIQPTFVDLGTMGDNGLVAAQQTTDALYGYVNAKGENKIAAVYEDADDFHDGIAVVEVGGKKGVINDAGSYVIQPTYDDLENLGDGIVEYELNGKVGALNKRGEILIQPVYEDFGDLVDNDLIPARQNGKWGYINGKGSNKIAHLYEDAESFFEGYAWVRQGANGVYVLINTKGDIQFALGRDEQYLTGFHNGLALVAAQSTGTTGYQRVCRYINVKGETIYTWTMTPSGGWNAPAQSPDKPSLKEQTLHFRSSKLF